MIVLVDNHNVDHNALLYLMILTIVDNVTINVKYKMLSQYAPMDFVPSLLVWPALEIVIPSTAMDVRPIYSLPLPTVVHVIITVLTALYVNPVNVYPPSLVLLEKLNVEPLASTYKMMPITVDLVQ